MRYAALIRPVIDRVYVSMRAAARPYTQKVVEEAGLSPGFIASFYFGLLARPMPQASLEAALTYVGFEMDEERRQGITVTDESGAWYLTESGRSLALAFEAAVARGAAELWGNPPIATVPGLDSLPRLAVLLERLLESGAASGGPAFAAMAPVHEPSGASMALIVSSRLGALRHHRADAHRAAWRAAGLTLEELRALPAESPVRREIEDETNRRDTPVYQGLSEAERWELMALLGALPG